jgi:V-type H+-transporting ATPase subunit a
MNASVSDFKRKYVNNIRVCCDMERRLNFIEKEILKNDIPIPEPSCIPDAPYPSDVDELEVSSEHTLQRC